MRSQGRTGSTSVGEKVGEAHYDEVKCLWEEEKGKDLKTRGKQKRRKKNERLLYGVIRKRLEVGGLGNFYILSTGPSSRYWNTPLCPTRRELGTLILSCPARPPQTRLISD